MSVPNQRRVYIERSSDKARANFFKVSNESLASAMYNLRPSAFKLWVYFADNANGYAMDLYPIDFCEKTQLSKSTYDRAFDELEEKGYLIKSTKSKNLYMFKEISERAEQPDCVNSLNAESFEEIRAAYFEE